MTKKESGLIKISGKLLKLAPAMAQKTCIAVVGEPKLPKKLMEAK